MIEEKRLKNRRLNVETAEFLQCKVLNFLKKKFQEVFELEWNSDHRLNHRTSTSLQNQL